MDSTEHATLSGLMRREADVVNEIMDAEEKLQFHIDEGVKATKALEDRKKELHEVRTLIKEYFDAINARN